MEFQEADQTKLASYPGRPWLRRRPVPFRKPLRWVKTDGTVNQKAPALHTLLLSRNT